MATRKAFTGSGSTSSIRMYKNPAYEEKDLAPQSKRQTRDLTTSVRSGLRAPDLTQGVSSEVKLRQRSRSVHQLSYGRQPGETVVHGAAVKVNIFKSSENVNNVEPPERRRRSFHEYLPAAYVGETLKMLGLDPLPSQPPVIKQSETFKDTLDMEPCLDSVGLKQKDEEVPKNDPPGGQDAELTIGEVSPSKATTPFKGETERPRTELHFEEIKVRDTKSTGPERLSRSSPVSSSERLKKLGQEQAPWLSGKDPGRRLLATSVVPDLIPGASSASPDKPFKSHIDILERLHGERQSVAQSNRIMRLNEEKAPWATTERSPRLDSALHRGKEMTKEKKWDRTEEVYQKCLEMLPRLREESSARMGSEKIIQKHHIAKGIALEATPQTSHAKKDSPLLRRKKTAPTDVAGFLCKDHQSVLGNMRESEPNLRARKRRVDLSRKVISEDMGKTGGDEKKEPPESNVSESRLSKKEATDEATVKPPADLDTRSRMILNLKNLIAIKSWNLQALDVRMRLVAMDTMLSFLLLTPLIILHYYATFRLLQCLFLDHFPHFGPWVLLSIGLAIEFSVTFFQRSIISRVPRRNPNPMADNIPFTLTAKAYNYVLAFGNICHMLAAAELVRLYVGTDVGNSFRAAVTSLVLLWSLRCGRNVVAAPLAISVDTDEPSSFAATTLFQTEPDHTIENILDSTATVGVVYTFIHLHWAGVWNCFEAVLFPNVFWLSMIISVAAGYALCTGFLVLQRHAREISQHLEKTQPGFIKILFENVFLTGGNMGAILLWKGLWMVYDLMADYFPIYCKTCDITPLAAAALSFILLSLAHTSSSLIIKGCEIDGELMDGEGVCFVTGYFTELLKDQIEDMELQEVREKKNARSEEKQASLSRSLKQDKLTPGQINGTPKVDTIT